MNIMMRNITPANNTYMTIGMLIISIFFVALANNTERFTRNEAKGSVLETLFFTAGAAFFLLAVVNKFFI
jgi:hypothetical protein